MITLTLRIDNLDTLPDGGPLRYTADERGFSIGRNESLDWTLPDPSRFISGKHCEIRFEQGGYWLSDVSTNGTFINGSRQRVKSPYRLSDGDRIAIGHYVIAAVVNDDQNIARRVFGEMPPSAPPAGRPSDDIWGAPAPGPAPMDRRELMPAQKRGQRAADFSQEFLDLPDMRPPPAGASRSAPDLAPRDAFGEPSSSRMPTPRHSDDPFSASSPPRFVPEPLPPVAPAEPLFADAAPFSGDAAVRSALPRGSADGRGGQAEIIRRFARGAGFDPEVLADADPGETAEEIGRMIRIVVEDVQQLLKARSAAKLLAKSSKRTMLGRMNNPLKFLPSPEEVLEVLLTRRRPGYMPGPDAFREALGDLKRHELATYAAMQTALSRLLGDLSPEAIEGKVTGSAFTSRKARNWDMYVARWEAKTEPHENGMLDVFLAYFADAYDEGAADRSA